MNLSNYLAAKSKKTDYPPPEDVASPPKARYSSSCTGSPQNHTFQNSPTRSESYYHEMKQNLGHHTPEYNYRRELNSPEPSSPYIAEKSATRGVFIRPNPDDIIKQGCLWIKKSFTWQKVYGIIIHEKKRLYMQIYSDEHAAETSRNIDLKEANEVVINDATRDDKGLRSFKIILQHFEIIFACDTIDQVESWVESIRSTKRSIQGGMVTDLEISPPPSTEVAMIKELFEILEVRASELGKMLHQVLERVNQLNGPENTHEQKYIETKTKLEQHTNYLEAQNWQLQNIFDLVSSSPELTRQLAIIETKLDLIHRMPGAGKQSSCDSSPSEGTLSDRILSIQDTVEFISNSHCKLVDLFSEKFKCIKGPTYKKEYEIQEVEKIDIIQDFLKKLDQQSYSNTLSLGHIEKSFATLSDKITKIHLEENSNDINFRKNNFAKFQRVLDDLVAKVSSLSSRNDNSPFNSPERSSPTLIMSINEKFSKIMIQLEDQRALHTLNGNLEEKLRKLVDKMIHTNKQEDTGHELRLLNEIKSSIKDLEHRMDRSGREHKTELDLLQGWMTRLHESLFQKQNRESLSINKSAYSVSCNKNLQKEIDSSIILGKIQSLEDKINALTIERGEFRKIISDLVNERREETKRWLVVEKSLDSIQSGLLLFGNYTPNNFESSSTRNIEIKLDQIIEEVAQLKVIKHDKSVYATNVVPSNQSEAIQRILDYQNDIIRRDRETSQSIESIQHTLSRLVECLEVGHSIGKIHTSSPSKLNRTE